MIAMPHQTVQAGLHTHSGDLIPLKAVRLGGELVGTTARVRVEQTYSVDGDKPVEAVYTFPVPSDAILSGFSMTCQGRRLDGEVRERERAFRDYARAVDDGHGAALLERDRANVLSVQVGNLLPGEETVVAVEFLQTVDAADGEWRWAIPTLVAPRYIPGTPQPGARNAFGHAEPTDRVPDADRITPPVALGIPYALEIDLAIDLGPGVEIESPSHEIVVERIGEGGHAAPGADSLPIAEHSPVAPATARHRVRFARPQALDRDLVLLVRAAGTEPVCGVATHRAGKDPGVVALTVLPDLLGEAPAQSSVDIVFVVDTSGSMAGAAISQARAALRLCLRHLRQGDRFDVIAFSSDWRAFAGHMVPFDQQALERADRWVEQLQASGGTEMLEPLRTAARQVARGAGGGVVVLMTDGEVGNEAEIVRAATQQSRGESGPPRFLTFGIGTNVSDVLLRDLARRTGGSAAFIHPGERIDDKVVAQLSRALAPRVDDLTLEFDGVKVDEVAPEPLPPLVDGEPWVVFGRFRKAGKGVARLRGRVGDQPFELDVPVALDAAGERPELAQRWAAMQIRSLEEATAVRNPAAIERQIVDLATTHGLLTSRTAYVAIEMREGERRTREHAQTRVIPVNVPAGWAMFGKGDDRADAPRSGVLPSMPSPGVARSFMLQSFDAAPHTGARGLFAEGLGDRDAAADPDAPMSPPPPRDTRMDRLKNDMLAPEPEREALRPDPSTPGRVLARQHASGLWGDPDRDLTAALEATREALDALARRGVRSNHLIHGRLIRKAITALLDRLSSAHAAPAALLARVVALAALLATGRLRKQVEDRIRDLGLADLVADQASALPDMSDFR